MTRLLGIVLCGGASTRMGVDKASLQDASGQTFLQIAHDRLAKITGEVCLSVAADHAGTNPDGIRGRYRCLPDRVFREFKTTDSIGPIGGLTTALQTASREGFDAILVTPVDTPALTQDDLVRLRNAFERDPTRIVCAVADNDASHSQTPPSEPPAFEPLIAVYPVSVLASFEQAIANQAFGLQRLLRETQCATVTLPAAHCHNINRPEDRLTDR